MSQHETVLIVDDNREIVFGTTLRLKVAGYEPLSASGGWEGVRMAREHRPDVILLDVQMPDLGGLETIDELKADESTRQIPVVVLSASLRDKQQALDRGARFFLPKPCRGEELLTAVRAAVSNPAVN
jgi:CheY-like chemotaxis protein